MQIDLMNEYLRQTYTLCYFFEYTLDTKSYRVWKTIFLIIFTVPFLAIKIPLALAILIYQAIGFSVCRALAGTGILLPISFVVGLILGLVNIVLRLISDGVVVLFSIPNVIAEALA